MVMAAQRAYSDAVSWMKEARPGGLQAGGLAWRLFRAIYVAAFLVLAAIGVLSPSRFGNPNSRPLRSAEWIALAVITTVVAVLVAIRRERVTASIRRLTEPFRRPLDHPSLEPAANALDSCPAAYRTRFALGWVWGPAAAVVLATVLAASSAYFLIDAVLARFEIGWQQPVLAGGQALVGLLVLRAVASKLSVWRLALSVHRSVTGAYI
jgi:hypothetical protein